MRVQILQTFEKFITEIVKKFQVPNFSIVLIKIFFIRIIFCLRTSDN